MEIFVDIVTIEPGQMTAEVSSNKLPFLTLTVTGHFKCRICIDKLYPFSTSTDFLAATGLRQPTDQIFSQLIKTRECPSCGISSVLPEDDRPTVRSKLDELVEQSMSSYEEAQREVVFAEAS